MDYEEYLNKESIRKLEKQANCHHHIFSVMIRCKDCGKLNTIVVDDVFNLPQEIDNCFHCIEKTSDELTPEVSS